MRPPECAICNKNFDPSGEECGLIYFKRRVSDEEWDKRMEEKGMVGHPPYAEWFCPKHYKKAKELQNLTIDEAMPKIRAFYQDK
ncbi:MAG: hypothetical protein ACTSO9_16635 [Candidatus Helarchaeota archaeon]